MRKEKFKAPNSVIYNYQVVRYGTAISPRHRGQARCSYDGFQEQSLVQFPLVMSLSKIILHQAFWGRGARKQVVEKMGTSGW